MGQTNINSSTQQPFYPVKWLAQNVLALTTTSHYPFPSKTSASIFPSFNLGAHVGDNLNAVINNREALGQLLANLSTNLSTAPKSAARINQPTKTNCFNQIQWLEQVHAANVVYLEQHSDTPLVADASITCSQQFALAIMTADCLPILLSAKDGSEIAAIHGGWRSLSLGIIAKTVNKMITSANNICVWLGPCIGKHAFEVGQEVLETFIAQSASFHQAFIKQNNNQYLADLHLIATQQLNQLGIFDINRLPHCTFSLADSYYSYRRDGQTGRMATVIVRV